MGNVENSLLIERKKSFQTVSKMSYPHGRKDQLFYQQMVFSVGIKFYLISAFLLYGINRV